MAYVNVPNDLSKVKTKLAFNLTKRQLVCFGTAAVIGIPSFLFTRSVIGNTASMLLMIVLMLPCFFFALYERDGLPFEKILRNIIRSLFLRPRIRPYKTQNLYSVLSNYSEEVKCDKTKTPKVSQKVSPKVPQAPCSCQKHQRSRKHRKKH